MKRVSFIGFGAALISSVMLTGCGSSTPPNSAASKATSADNDADHVHGEWWCGEHGVPEAICAQCDVTLAANFKAKGDWCDEHDRPDSQCFICSPEKEKEFAAQYEAKYGSQPPAREAEAADHDHDHEHGESEKAKS